MSPREPGLRVGIFAHSTNPRGGVVHAMQLAEALRETRVRATLLAPDAGGQGFFRTPRCAARPIAAAPAPRDTASLVELRRHEIARFLSGNDAPRFDIYHAQDSLSALALLDLVRAGEIPGYVRTVHHLDRFEDPRLGAWQDEAVRGASALFCVSEFWRRELARRFARDSTVVGNGVDLRRFGTDADARDAALRRRLLPEGGRMILALGGIEARKNTCNTLRGFLELAGEPAYADLRLVVAGGASLLDHRAEHAAFAEIVLASPHRDRVVLAGIVADADMPALYRAAALFCFPSLAEGFGLCALEALASGIPLIVPEGAPFDEYLAEGDALRVDPGSAAAIAGAMRAGLEPEAAREAARLGPLRAAGFGWDRVARRHLPVYTERLCSSIPLAAHP